MLLRRVPIGRLEELAQFHRYLAGIGKLNSNGVFPGNRREDVDSFGARCSCKVALEAHDFVHPDAFGRIDFIPRDSWTFRDVARPNGNAKLRQSLDQDLLDFL